MGTFTGTGGQASTEKGQDISQGPGRELIFSALTAMTPMSQNLNWSYRNLLRFGPRTGEMSNKSSTFLRGIKPRRKIILSHSSPHKSCGVFSKVLDKNYTRREFIRNLSVTALAGLSLPLLSSCSPEEAEDFLQKHFLEMTEEEKKQVIAKLERRYLEQYGRKFQISTHEALPETLWGYGLELSRCIGCRRCVYACAQENNNSRYARQLHWIRVLRLKRGNLINLEDSEHYYTPETVPEKGFVYLPVQCQQCQNPPCVKACPIHATWQEPDGIIVVDYNWCIGCRYCIAACPYKGRVFNWAEPNLPKDEVNPNVHYLGNRPRMKCAVEKCTFCIQRVRQGRYPACVEACPTGARKFGNLLDPKSEIRYIIERKRVFRLREELNTESKFYYFFES